MVVSNGLSAWDVNISLEDVWCYQMMMVVQARFTECSASVCDNDQCNSIKQCFINYTCPISVDSCLVLDSSSYLSDD